jgi:phenylacetate-CoA ligase
MTADMNAKIASFVKYAYDKAPGVRRWLDAAGVHPDDIRSEADLNRIPVLSKDKMVELQAEDPPFGGFLAVPMSEVTHVFFSPGPLYEPGGEETMMMDTAEPLFRKAGFGKDGVALNTLSYHLVPAGLMIDTVLQRVGTTVIPVGVGNADLQIKMMVDFGADGYVGTPSWLATLFKKAEEMGIPASQLPLRHVLLTAEPLSATMRTMFIQEYGLRVTNAYATAELGFLAYDQEGQMAMRLLEGPLIQLVDRDTGDLVGPGDAGEVVITNFNQIYPLIRFGTGDLAVNVDPAPGQSRQGDRSIILVGRVGDAVKVRGMFVHPNQLRFALARFPVANHRAVVRRPELRDELTLQVVLSAEPEDKDALANQIRSAVRDVCRVKLDHLEFVAALPEDGPKIVDERSWD